VSWTQVQKKLVNGTAAQSAVPFDANVTVGNLLLAIPGMNVANQTTTPSVSGLTLAEEKLGPDCSIGIFYGRATATGPLSIQGSGFTGSYSLAIAEYSFSAAGVPTLDQHTDNQITTAGTSVSGLLPPITSADELVVVAARTAGANSTPRSWSNAFNEQHNMNSRGSWATIHASSATGFSTAYSWTNNFTAALAFASFKAVSTPVADRVQVRLSNAFAAYPLKVRLSNAWVTVN